MSKVTRYVSIFLACLAAAIIVIGNARMGGDLEAIGRQSAKFLVTGLLLWALYVGRLAKCRFCGRRGVPVLRAAAGAGKRQPSLLGSGPRSLHRPDDRATRGR